MGAGGTGGGRGVEWRALREQGDHLFSLKPSGTKSNSMDVGPWHRWVGVGAISLLIGGAGLVVGVVPASAQAPGPLIFAAPVTYPVSTSPTGVAVATYAGQSYAVVLSQPYNNLTVFPLTVVGTVVTAGASSYGLGACDYPDALAVGDLNGDGIPDVAVACAYTSTPGNGGIPSGTWRNGSVAVLLGTSGGAGLGLAAASQLYCPMGDYPGATASSHSVGFSGGCIGPSAVTIAKMGNGHPDIVTANEGSDNVSVWAGNGDGSFVTSTAADPAYPSGIALDSTPDNFQVGPHASRAISPLYFPDSVAVGDLNGDGHPDVVTTNLVTGNISVLLGNGDGTLQSATMLGLGGAANPESVALGDFNDDGHLDIAIGDNMVGLSGGVTVFLNKGNGTFATPVSKADGTTGTQSELFAADMNGDGQVDLVAATQTATSCCPVSVLVGNGNRTFASPTVVTIAGMQAAAVADLNGDGKPDIVTANTASVSVVINTTPVISTSSQSVSVGVTYVPPPGVLSISDPQAAVSFGDLDSGAASVAMGLGDINDIDTLIGTNPWSATVAATDLVSGSTSIPWTNLSVAPGATIAANAGATGPLPASGAGGAFASGTDTTPGTTLSPGLTLATGQGATKGSYTQSGSTATLTVPPALPSGSYGGTLQYTMTG